ncbi:MAG TPA: methyltransferase [Candidatus Binatus sp.]|uniref:tRNA1(Val) (adenine(37)-N6)-methyltransferase n=1 Tax=Candidatus Binatus sp. TaxID=2811406 RepID=UPI002B4A3EA2|nr:methyltransferase [Candidatus Binatus sp.]HKN13144.1 methyltransferase [Candidatus Binatus sp.]
MTANSSDETHDTVLGGSITLIQPRHGYRFSIEAILLGRFAGARKRERVLELGAGCGVVSIMIAALCRAREVVALEIQPALAEMIVRNAEINGLESVRAVCADLRQKKIAGVESASFDLIVANPPYRAAASGRENPEHGRRLARGENVGTLADFVAVARRYARRGGRVAFVFTARRSAELISAMRSNQLEPKRIRLVHPRIAMPASVMLIEARLGGGIEVTVEPPLILYERQGVYTAEARALLSSP